MKYFRWIGFAALAFLILAGILALLTVIRVLAFVFGLLIGGAFITLLLHSYFEERKQRRAKRTH